MANNALITRDAIQTSPKRERGEQTRLGTQVCRGFRPARRSLGEAGSLTLPARCLPVTGLPMARRKAFTFVEVLVTMSLLAIVLPTVMEGVSMSLGAAGLAKQQSQASGLAYGKMTELLTEEQWDHPSLSGDFAPDNPEFRWTAQLTEWDGATLQQLDVTVTWIYRGRDRSVTLSTLVNTGGQ